MGTFRVDATVSNLQDRGRSVTLGLLVGTGATYTTLPREVADALGLEPIDTRRIRLADGREELCPIAAILLRVGEQELSVAGPDRPARRLSAAGRGHARRVVTRRRSIRQLIPTTSYLVSPTSVTEGLPLSGAS